MKQTRIRKHTRHLLTGLGLFLLASLQPLLAQQNEAGQAAPVKLGLMLPYSGTYAPLGESITNGLKLAIKQNGDQLGGRPVEYVILDSEADASKAPQNMSRLSRATRLMWSLVRCTPAWPWAC